MTESKMGQVIEFRKKSAEAEPADSDISSSARIALSPQEEAIRLLQIADEIDSLIKKHLEAGLVDSRDLAGLIAHRLGALMRHSLTDENDERKTLLEVCEQVMRNQASLHG